MELECHPFELQECVESALDLIAPRAAEKRIDLAYTIEDGVPLTLIGDVTRVRQIMLNLLSNAVKFTEQGEIVVNITSQVASAGERETCLPQAATCKVIVRDTGIGIPAERMSRFFQSSQVDVSTSASTAAPVGLAISKRLF
jgi:signal transduction histidine kinase